MSLEPSPRNPTAPRLGKEGVRQGPGTPACRRETEVVLPPSAGQASSEGPCPGGPVHVFYEHHVPCLFEKLVWAWKPFSKHFLTPVSIYLLDHHCSGTPRPHRSFLKWGLSSVSQPQHGHDRPDQALFWSSQVPVTSLPGSVLCARGFAVGSDVCTPTEPSLLRT